MLKEAPRTQACIPSDTVLIFKSCVHTAMFLQEAYKSLPACYKDISSNAEMEKQKRYVRLTIERSNGLRPNKAL